MLRSSTRSKQASLASNKKAGEKNEVEEKVRKGEKDKENDKDKVSDNSNRERPLGALGTNSPGGRQLDPVEVPSQAPDQALQRPDLVQEVFALELLGAEPAVEVAGGRADKQGQAQQLVGLLVDVELLLAQLLSEGGHLLV